MTSRLVLRLRHSGYLTDRDEAKLDQLTWRSFPVAKGVDVAREGDSSPVVHVLLEGLACRYRRNQDGRRQIVALLLPGDFCDMHVAILNEMDHSIGAMTDCRLATIQRAEIGDLPATYPNIMKAMWWSTLADESIMRAWLAGMGGLSAEARLSHFFCEVVARFAAIGVESSPSLDLPLTQADIGDVIGVSPVHVNRMLQQLRAERLISYDRGRLTVLDDGRLAERAEFSARYLHLGRPQSLTSVENEQQQ